MFVRVLSLPSATARRDVVSRELMDAGIGFRFFDGIDARVHQVNRAMDSVLTSGEAACALGHVNIYREFLASDEQWALVFEDDVELVAGFGSVLGPLIEIVSGQLKCKSGVVLLGQQEGIRSHLYFVGLFCGAIGRYKVLRSFRSAEYVFGTFGYLINREAARRIADANCGLVYRADEWGSFVRKGVINEVLVVKPSLVIHPEGVEGSTIEHRSTDRSRKSLGCRMRAKVEIAFRVGGFLGRLILAKCLPVCSCFQRVWRRSG